MALPPLEPLYEHLAALRDADEPADPRHDPRWREVARWLEHAFGGRARGMDDVRQEALMSLIRHVREMRAETPQQAAKWVSTIVRRKRIDAARGRARDPIERALEREPLVDGASPIERLTASEGSADPRALERLVTSVLEHVHRALEETEPNARKRLLRRAQAQATLLRVVCDADADVIAGALDHGEPMSRDRVYKWIERGRSTVELGLDRWERTCSAEEHAETEHVIAALRELVSARRSDAGVPRPERRKDRAEELP